MVNAGGSWAPRPSFGRVLGLLAAFVAWMIAGVAGLMLAAVVTALLVVAGLVGGAAVALTGKVPRARAPAKDPDLIEAHNVGGHSWVAYGADGH
jgi:hypothetical protein